jgi:hypothetical protein
MYQHDTLGFGLSDISTINGVSSPIEMPLRFNRVLVWKHDKLGLNSGLITIFRSILSISITCNILNEPAVVLGSNCISFQRGKINTTPLGRPQLYHCTRAVTFRI